MPKYRIEQTLPAEAFGSNEGLAGALLNAGTCWS